MSTTASDLLTQRSFLTAGGTETYLLFEQKFPLRDFCAFEIFENDTELRKLETDYLYPLMSAIDSNGHGMLLDALVWRAHPDFIAALGYSPADVARLNQLAVSRTKQAIDGWRATESRNAQEFPVLTAADIGPRGDGYKLGDRAPSVENAFNYHREQMQALATTDVDVICAWTMTNANESIGVAKAAAELDIPVIISATVETDGRLPDDKTLAEFVRTVDEATDAKPLFYMVNCAHPSHLASTLEDAKTRNEDWLKRFRGFRANSSKRSHEELDNCPNLDRGNPQQLAEEIAGMKQAFDLMVVGGCCGTDVEHIAAIARATANGSAR